MFAGTCARLEKCPSRPAIELTSMNGAATADVARVSAQPIYKSRGLRKIPPPTPVRPDRNPIVAPHKRAAHIGGRCVSLTIGLSADRNIQTAAYRRTTPTMTLYQRVGRIMAPPRKAAGIETTANG